LWQERAEKKGMPKSQGEQMAIQAMHNDPQMRFRDSGLRLGLRWRLGARGGWSALRQLAAGLVCRTRLPGHHLGDDSIGVVNLSQ
jgi:hypothetical protein